METAIDRWIRKGEKRGLREGKREEALNITLRLLQKRFGELESRIEGRIQRLPVEKVEQLSEALLDFEKPEDLKAWLKENAAK